MRFLKTVLSWALFASLILILGQIRVGRQTIAEQVHSRALYAWDWGKDQIGHSDTLAGLNPSKHIDWLFSKFSSIFNSVPDNLIHRDSTPHPFEEMDEEALLRYLE